MRNGTENVGSFEQEDANGSGTIRASSMTRNGHCRALAAGDREERSVSTASGTTEAECVVVTGATAPRRGGDR